MVRNVWHVHDGLVERVHRVGRRQGRFDLRAEDRRALGLRRGQGHGRGRRRALTAEDDAGILFDGLAIPLRSLLGVALEHVRAGDVLHDS